MLEMGADAANIMPASPARSKRRMPISYLPRPPDGGVVGGNCRLAPRRLCREFRRYRGALVNALQDGDAVLVKGSFGSKMAVIVEALKMRGGVMLYYFVASTHTTISPSSVCSATSPSARRGADDGAADRLHGRSGADPLAAARQGKGQPIRTDGPSATSSRRRARPPWAG